MAVNLPTINFNIFEYEKNTKLLNELLVLMFEKLDLIKELKIDKDSLVRFIRECQSEYQDVPFHNFIHAFDVTQMVFCLLMQGRARELLRPKDCLVLLIAAIAHDMGHPGLSNTFLARTQAIPFKIYGMDSTLEIMAFEGLTKILQRKDCAILSSFVGQEREEMVNKIYDLIIATDMAIHLNVMTQFNLYKKEIPQLNPHEEVNEAVVLVFQKCILKCADLSNAMRPPKVAKQWAHKISEEFFLQGDQERALNIPISPNMDRDLGSLAILQSTFIEAIVKPFVQNFVEVLPSEYNFLGLLEENYQSWKELAANSE
jgi:high affinity cGMP-specific 3',5'-cyclic phosphodiesterase 9